MICLDLGTYYSRGNGYGSGHGRKICACEAGTAHTEEEKHKKDLAEYNRLKRKLDKRAKKIAEKDVGSGI